MPRGVFVELELPVERVGKFLGFARAMAPAFLPRLKTLLPDFIRSNVPVLAPVLALEQGFDLGAFVTGLLGRRIGYLDMPEPILQAAVACLEAHATDAEPLETP